METPAKINVQKVLTHDRAHSKGARSSASTIALFKYGGGVARILLSYSDPSKDYRGTERLSDAEAQELVAHPRFACCTVLRVNATVPRQPGPRVRSTPPRLHAIRDPDDNVLATGKTLAYLKAFIRKHGRPVSTTANACRPEGAILHIQWGTPTFAYTFHPFQSLVVLQTILARSRTLTPEPCAP